MTRGSDPSPEAGGQDRSAKPVQGGSGSGRNQASSPQLGERSADAQPNADGGGMASTEGRSGSEGGLGSAQRSASQEQSRGGQMGPSDDRTNQRGKSSGRR